MALELKPGIVKYNNREDIVCYYGEVNGVTYYFLTFPENKIYPYQNRINLIKNEINNIKKKKIYV